MLTFYGYETDTGILSRTILNGENTGPGHSATSNITLPPGTVWIDMLMPTTEEKAIVESLLDIHIPTREEMAEIELSSRLYVDGPALVMTMPILNNSATDDPESAPTTFILVKHRLITIRYADPLSFSIFTRRVNREPSLISTGEHALLGLLDQITDRLADILETSIADLKSLSREVFRSPARSTRSGPDFNVILRRIGRAGDLGSKIKDSLLGMSRLLLFLNSQGVMKGEYRERTKTLMRDVASINEHVSFVSTKIAFLLDATLGLINIEQSGIIKIFSVAAVAFLPPTLIASIYGMNFKFMPELDWHLGYPFAILLMILSAVIPFTYFRYKKWL